MMKKNPRALISVVWVKQKKLSFYHLYPKRLEKKTYTIGVFLVKDTIFVLHMQSFPSDICFE